jgi:hypothetical protein
VPMGPFRVVRVGAGVRCHVAAAPSPSPGIRVALPRLGSGRPGRLSGSARLVRRSTPVELLCDRTARATEVEHRAAPLARCAFLQRSAATAPRRRRSMPVRTWSRRRGFLSWAFLPYSTLSDRRTHVLGGVPEATRVPRPGFEDPHRGAHRRPYRRARRRSAPGLRPSRRSPRRGVCPSRDHGPPGVRALLRERASPGLRPRDESVLHRTPEEPGRRCLLGIHPSRALSPAARAPALARGRPSRPWVVRRPVSPGPQGFANRPNRLARLGLPALLGFGTLRPSQRSVHGAWRRAYGFASRRGARSRAVPAL